MKKIIDWIMKYPKETMWVIAALIVGPMLLVQLLFLIPAPCKYLVAVWGEGDMLGYFGDIISFIGTIFLGFIAVSQTEEANLLSAEMVKLEWEKRKPYFDIVQNQEYNLFFEMEEIKQCLDRYDIANDMKISPRYIKEKRTGITTTIAVMQIEVKNIGNSDIRNIFVKESTCYLSAGLFPQEYDKCVVFPFEGNTYIKAGECRKLFIEFKQELDEENDNIQEQVGWAKESIKMVPSFNLNLHIITADGNEYEEKLSLETSIAVIANENTKIIRNLGTIDINVEKIG
ncbi:MAG: hypothetical protein IKU67_04010 [Firmicutes bacterium]|nr:hypothetical protein [Bacillota bacterium]